MERRRTDLAIGLVVAVAAHGAVLAAAGGMLSSHNAAPLSTEPRPPLEVLVVEEQAWRAQLEESQPMRIAQPREVPKVHQPTQPPDWPELDVARPLEQSLAVVVPIPRDSFDTVRPQVAPPRELVQPEPLVERMQKAESAVPVVEAAAPVPISSASSLVLYRPELRYPSRAHRRGIEGVVRVGMKVDSKGEVTRTWILKSSGNRELDRAALANLRSWRFDPQAVAKAGLAGLFRNDVRFEID